MPELLPRFPNLKNMIVGEDGDDRSRLEEKVKSLGLSKRIIFAGKIWEHEKVAHFWLADESTARGLDGLMLLHAVFR